ncbi:MAG: FkbM family methyltransferase [Shinella sp.]|nr:FkbM family methyltransferase [Shinella sp.]
MKFFRSVLSVCGLSVKEATTHAQGGGKLLMPGLDVTLPEVAGRIGGTLMQGRWYEQEMLDYIRSLHISGNYLDVGANIGNHSLYFAMNTGADRVFSFEPTQGARATLNKFIELNRLHTEITVIPFACSDFNGEVEVVESIAREVKPTKYQCRKIDDLINVPVTLIKMDIEGAESSALKGAIRVLGECKPVLFIEIHDNAHMNDIMNIIRPLGYRATGRVWNASPTYEFVAD